MKRNEGDVSDQGAVVQTAGTKRKLSRSKNAQGGSKRQDKKQAADTTQRSIQSFFAPPQSKKVAKPASTHVETGIDVMNELKTPLNTPIKVESSTDSKIKEQRYISSARSSLPWKCRQHSFQPIGQAGTYQFCLT